MRYCRLILMTLVVSSCNVGKPYHRPASEIPDEWKGPTQETTKEIDDLGTWWEIFEDQTLNGLEAQAIEYNQSLRAAFARLLNARALARVNGADLYPGITLQPAFFTQESLFQNPVPPIAGIPTPKNFRFQQKQYTLPLDLSYQVDLWGQLHNSYYAAVANAQAAYESLHTVLLTITADVAQNYFLLRSLDAQQAVQQKGIAIRQNAVEINQVRYKAGLINFVDVTRAQTELHKAIAESINIKRQRALQENIIAVLIGMPASEFEVAVDPLLFAPPGVPAGIPSEVLCRRPDIAEAERQMASLHAQIGVAYASQFPSLLLTGSTGFQSPDFASLLLWKARLWSFGVNIVQTVFDAGRTQANIDAAIAQYYERVANYQDRVLVAFQEVEDALVNIDDFGRQAKELNEAADAATITRELSQERYTKGLVNYLDVVDAERQQLDTKRAAVKVIGDQYVSTVQLIKALGGSWCQ